MTSGRLPLNLIKTDGGTQTRGVMIDGVVNDYMELLDVLPPVVVFHDGEAYWLADGFHRLRAFEKAGQHDIPAEIRQGTRRDAILFSVGANAEHGLRRTRADKQRAVLTLLHDAEWGAWSDSEIARRCHVSHTMVATQRSSIAVPLGGKSSVTCKVASERTYQTKHGTTATMKTAAIGGGDRRQREPQPVRDRPHQQVAAPVQHVEPSEFQGEHRPSFEKWRDDFRQIWASPPRPADRKWAIDDVIADSLTIKERRRLLFGIPITEIDPETGEILSEQNSSDCQGAVGAGQPEGIEVGQVAPTIETNEPVARTPIEQRQGPDIGETPPPALSGPTSSPDPAPITPAEGAAAASACGEGTPAASSTLSGDDWANSHEVRSAPEMPDFLRRTS